MLIISIGRERGNVWRRSCILRIFWWLPRGILQIWHEEEGGAMYRKEIIYIGLYKDGGRIGSAGFLKVENKGDESRLYLKLQNVPLGINGRFPIRVYGRGGWKEIKPVTVQDGGGNWEENLAENMDRTVIQIMLPGGYILEGKSKYAPETVMQRIPEERQEEQKGQNGAGNASIRNRDSIEDNKGQSVSAELRHQDSVGPGELPGSMSSQSDSANGGDMDDVSTAKPQYNPPAKEMQDLPEATMQDNMEEYVRAKQDKEAHTPQTIIITEELPRRKMGDTVVVPRNAPEYSLKEDKWEQILDTYEQIHPYGDERIYVKLEPKDFVILQSKYQHLVNNSFLLHGFYNYRYIILGKEQDYYLGVPGVFYEREKMVALMFGFEAFECPGGNVRPGEFGYYLRKVEL